MSSRIRLDQCMAIRGLSQSRSQAGNLIRLGKVLVDGRIVQRPSYLVSMEQVVDFVDRKKYVSRAGLKLASVVQSLDIDFIDKTVLDVGSSTGGFTDYALQHGAKKVIAVDVGTDQLHPSLRSDSRIELHEKTDIRHFKPDDVIDTVVIDVSFISLRDILPYIKQIASKTTNVIAMVKPQFEAGKHQVSKGVIKNDAIRRQILKDFEAWVKEYFIITNKADSKIAGAKGNRERFYLLQSIV
jgi:23S rRNA (cytidine1920-2'-O)/16S rRNA (cytidine1409-2'-O)-methyltransferase